MTSKNDYKGHIESELETFIRVKGFTFQRFFHDDADWKNPILDIKDMMSDEALDLNGETYGALCRPGNLLLEKANKMFFGENWETVKKDRQRYFEEKLPWFKG